MNKIDLTIEQYGKISKLIEGPMIDSVHFNNANPFKELVIKVIGQNEAIRILKAIKTILPDLEATVRFWELGNEHYPMYCYSALDFQFDITLAVMPKDIGGNDELSK